jgi:hypothetical protein
MVRITFCAMVVGAVVLAESLAIGQIVGPARRAAAGAAGAVGAPGVGARIENREAARGVTLGDRWRYTNQANQWWYYTSQNSWMYYQNNAWTPYDAATYTGAIPAAPMVPAGYGADRNSWRYVYNGDQWWYYTPQNSWMYYGTNQWQPYQAGANAAPRYTTGYRGTYNTFGNSPGAPPQPPVNPADRDRNPEERRDEGRGGAANSDQRNQAPNQPQGSQPQGSQPQGSQPQGSQPQGSQPRQQNSSETEGDQPREVQVPKAPQNADGEGPPRAKP